MIARPRLTVIRGRPAANAPLVRPEYARHGYTEAESPSAPADAFMAFLRTVASAFLLLAIVACAVVLMFSLHRVLP